MQNSTPKKPVRRPSADLELTILEEKKNGTPDYQIGKKYGVTLRYLERIITKHKGVNISRLEGIQKINNLSPKGFKEEHTSIWSFRRRGNWATHNNSYRGNWSPYIPRNIILKYSSEGETVLDYFCGAGTTAIEAKVLGRKCIAIDINEKAIELAKQNLAFNLLPHQTSLPGLEDDFIIYEPMLRTADARELSFLSNDSIDLICAHPPYANIIHYTFSNDKDLSFLEVEPFLEEIRKVAEESYRVLKPGRKCAILIGDMRKNKKVVPLGFMLIDVFLKTGFILKELIIKQQHNCKTTGFWYENSIKHNFLLLAHEYLPVFEKPTRSSQKILKEEYSYIETQDEEAVLPVKTDITNKHETTTVWKFPKEHLDISINANVIERYAKNNSYLLLSNRSFSDNNEDKSSYANKENDKLLFIKSPVLDLKADEIQIKTFTERIVKLVDKWTAEKEDGFVVIQARDVRLNGTLIPVAKILFNSIKNNSLHIKEIIVTCYDPAQDFGEPVKKTSTLNIVHSYLLVYEIK